MRSTNISNSTLNGHMYGLFSVLPGMIVLVFGAPSGFGVANTLVLLSVSIDLIIAYHGLYITSFDSSSVES